MEDVQDAGTKRMDLESRIARQEPAKGRHRPASCTTDRQGDRAEDQGALAGREVTDELAAKARSRSDLVPDGQAWRWRRFSRSARRTCGAVLTPN